MCTLKSGYKLYVWGKSYVIDIYYNEQNTKKPWYVIDENEIIVFCI